MFDKIKQIFGIMFFCVLLLVASDGIKILKLVYKMVTQNYRCAGREQSLSFDLFKAFD